MQDGFSTCRLNIWSLDRMTIGDGGYRWDWNGLIYPHWRIYWNRQPGASVSFADEDIQLDPDHVVVIAPRTPIDHKITGSVEHTFFHVILGYPYDKVSPRVDRIPVKDLPMNLLEIALTDIYTGEYRAQNLSIRPTLAAQSFVCGVMSALPEGIWSEPASTPSIRELAYAISREPELDYRTSDMAKRCHMSVNTLLRHFKDEIGQTPRQLVTECRLQMACDLLTNTNTSIELIAESCGYNNRYYFSKVFKANYRCGPATFRNRPACLSTFQDPYLEHSS